LFHIPKLSYHRREGFFKESNLTVILFLQVTWSLQTHPEKSALDDDDDNAVVTVDIIDIFI